MKRSLILFLSLILVVLLGVTGGILFLFSEQGNAMLKPYLQQRLSQELGVPVEIRSFHLQSGRVSAKAVVDGRAQVGVIARYDLWKRSFRGAYRVVAHDLVYDGAVLRQADIKGRFAGTPDTVLADGKGTALDAPVDFRLKMHEQKIVSIQADAHDLSLRELLQFAKQPPLAKGAVDVKIDMPHIGEEGAKGDGKIMVRKGYLSRREILKAYGYPLPKDMPFTLHANAILKGMKITFGARSKSTLFDLKLDDGNMDVRSGALHASYDLNVQQLRILSQNKLAGALHLKGEIERKEKILSVKGESGSLGGDLRFAIGKEATISMQGVWVEKVLAMLRQPHYLSGRLSGKVQIADIEQMQQGNYILKLTQDRPDVTVVHKRFGYTLPPHTTLEADSKGMIKQGILYADTTLRSDLATLILPKLQYHIDTKHLQTGFNLRFAKIAQGVVFEGKAAYDGKVSLYGEAKGLGRKLAFGYDGTRARIDGKGVHIDKVLAVAGLPHYLKGALDAAIVLDDTTRMNGSYKIYGKNLVTVPSAMKQLVGKPLKLGLSVDAKGVFKARKAYGSTVIDTTLGTLRMEKMVADLTQGTFQTRYRMDIRDLSKLYALVGTRLYGALLTTGKASKGRMFRLDGSTASLGGRIDYALAGERFDATIKSVPLEGIMKLLGYAPNFLGTASGKTEYHLARRRGTADLTLASFQIKPNQWTRLLTPVLGKDPSRIIFKTTTLHADIKGDIVTYQLHAKGTHSAIDVTNGRIDNKTGTQYAKFKAVYEKYTVFGKLKGTIEHPKVTIDTSRILQEKLQKKFGKKLEKELGKSLGGKAGALLKGLGL